MGERQSGQDVRSQNVMACQAVANIVKSSLGPVGLDKVVEAVQAVKMTNARGEIKYPIKVSTFADMEGEETFDSSLLGHADEVVEERIADDDIILIKGTKTSSAVSLILRGANDSMLDEMERALHDSLSIVKRTLESNTVLAVNAAKDATELVAKLRAYHNTAQTEEDKKHLSSMGLDLSKGTIRNNLEAGVIEPAMSKVKILQFATEAAITILRIDDMIRLVKDESQNGKD